MDPGPRLPRTVLLIQPRAPRAHEWLSMYRYTGGLLRAIHGRAEVTIAEANHLDLPRPLRRLSARYRDLPPLPRRWPGRLDLVHFTDAFTCVHQDRFEAARVATIHDVIPLDFVGRWPPRLAYWRFTFERSLRAAGRLDAVVTPSEATRRAVIERGRLDPGRVFAVPIPVAEGIRPAAGPREPATILSVGTIARYKNLPLLLHALARPELAGVRLVRIGHPFGEKLRALAAGLGVRDRVEERGHVDDAALFDALRTATVLAQPSLTEGFGLPVAEAMAAGLPVVVSDGGALPEIAGSAGRVVPLTRHLPGPIDGDDVSRFAQALAEVIRDPALQRRMSDDGLREAARFTPESVAVALERAYAAAMANARARTGA